MSSVADFGRFDLNLILFTESNIGMVTELQSMILNNEKRNRNYASEFQVWRVQTPDAPACRMTCWLESGFHCPTMSGNTFGNEWCILFEFLSYPRLISG